MNEDKSSCKRNTLSLGSQPRIGNAAIKTRTEFHQSATKTASRTRIVASRNQRAPESGFDASPLTEQDGKLEGQMFTERLLQRVAQLAPTRQPGDHVPFQSTRRCPPSA